MSTSTQDGFFLINFSHSQSCWWCFLSPPPPSPQLTLLKRSLSRSTETCWHLLFQSLKNCQNTWRWIIAMHWRWFFCKINLTTSLPDCVLPIFNSYCWTILANYAEFWCWTAIFDCSELYHSSFLDVLLSHDLIFPSGALLLPLCNCILLSKSWDGQVNQGPISTSLH